MSERLVGVPEAALRLNLEPVTLREMCRTGKTPVRFVKRGGRKSEWVCRDSELVAYVDSLFGAQPEAVGQ